MISVVIPALNEEGVIADTILSVRRVFADAKLEAPEVIVIDDGSQDATGRLSAESGAKVIRHPHNLGYGRSLKDGIIAASNDIIVITDADGTYPLEEIPNLLERLELGFDMVVGARTGKHYRGSVVKSPLRAILKFLVEFTAGRRVDDVNSGLRVFRRSTILPYLRPLCDTFSFTTSLTMAYMLTNKFVVHVPIAYHERVGETKVKMFRDSLRTLQYIVQAIVYYNPLKIFIIFSLIFAFVGVISFGFAIAFDVDTAFLFGTGSILVSMLVFCMGLLAVLLGQILTDRRSDSDQIVPPAHFRGDAD